MLENKVEDLLKSIQEDNNNDIVEIIRKSHLLLLADEYLRKTGNAYALKSRILQVKQKSRYEVFRTAIGEFLEECDKYNLKPVFMKGIFLATDLYEKIEKRPSHDIDVIIKLEEFSMYYKIMKELGYTYKFYRKDRDAYEDHYHELKERHLGYYKEMNSTVVNIELHSAIMGATTLFLNTVDEFINSAVKKDFLGLTPYVLDTEHNLIQLALHFYKHLNKEYFHNMIFGREYSVNLSNIHDIALLQNKYQDQIDENKLLQIAKDMKVVRYISFVFELVNKMYGGLFRTEFLKMLSDNAAYSQINSIGSEGNGFGKLVWLFDIYIDYCKEITMKQFVLGDMPQEFNLIDILLPDQSQLLCVKDGEELKVKEEYAYPMKINNQDKEVDVQLDILIDAELIKINYRVDNKQCCAFNEQTEYCYEKDGVEIVVIKDQSVIHRMYTVSNLNNQLSMIMFSSNTEEVIDLGSTDVKYFLDIHENDFVINLEIPWSSLDINPSMDKIIPFNIACLISNPETLTHDGWCTLFNKDELIWNFKDINGVKFE